MKPYIVLYRRMRVGGNIFHSSLDVYWKQRTSRQFHNRDETKIIKNQMKKNINSGCLLKKFASRKLNTGIFANFQSVPWLVACVSNSYKHRSTPKAKNVIEIATFFFIHHLHNQKD